MTKMTLENASLWTCRMRPKTRLHGTLEGLHAPGPAAGRVALVAGDVAGLPGGRQIVCPPRSLLAFSLPSAFSAWA